MSCKSCQEGWIGVECKTPEPSNSVLVTNGKTIWIGFFDNGQFKMVGPEDPNFGNPDPVTITHWMPMPNLP